MIDHPNLRKCQTYIDCQLQTPSSIPLPHERRPPALTISRQTGAGGLMIAEMLAQRLDASPLRTDVPWTVFDKNLVTKVLEDHNLPQRLAQYMPEDKISFLSDALEELLGLHPPSWDLLRQTSETVLKLAELGNVILVGRAANVITAKLKHIFHVRLTGSLEHRAARIQARRHLSPGAAADFIKQEDAARERYLKKHFRHDIDDPLLYHLAINTDWVTEAEAADLIAHIVIKKYAGTTVPEMQA
jgi:cytidylate kinase